MSYKTYKGVFTPKNPQKYIGDSSNIIYRSMWECKFMAYLDSHPDVVQWASEEFFIPYLSPIDNKVHKYFPDFWVKKKNRNGILEVNVIEIKPLKQTSPPKKQKRMTKTYLNEVKTWGINNAKWEAAKDFCQDRKWTFQIFSEKELGII